MELIKKDDSGHRCVRVFDWNGKLMNLSREHSSDDLIDPSEEGKILLGLHIWFENSGSSGSVLTEKPYGWIIRWAYILHLGSSYIRKL